jgi:hypothetical protein
MSIDYWNVRNGYSMAEKMDFYQRQFLLEILTFGGLGEQDDCSLTTESCAFGGKFAQNLASQPPKACFNQNFRNFAQIKDF